MKTLHIPTETGFLTGALHIPAKPAPRMQTLIFCHGFRGSMDGGGRAVGLAEKVAGLGIHALRFNFTPASRLSIQVEELCSVVNYAREYLGGTLYLLGRSMGGSAALAYSAEYEGVAGLCLWATPWNLTETFQNALGNVYDRLKTETVSLNDDYGEITLYPSFIKDFEQFSLLDSARRLKGLSLLQIHGSQDKVVSLRQAQDIWKEVHTSKKLVVIEGGDHHLAAHAEEASSAVLKWLKALNDAK